MFLRLHNSLEDFVMIKIVDGQPVEYSDSQLRRDHPFTIFPRVMTNAVRQRFGVIIEEEGTPTEGQIQDGYEQVNGSWRKRWRSKTAEEVTEERLRVRVTPYQLKMASIDLGHTAAIQSAIAGLSGAQRAKLQLMLDSKPRIQASEVWINTLLDTAGLTSEQKVELFTAAAAVEV